MFTGLIEEVGRVLRVEKAAAEGRATRLLVAASVLTPELKKGSSIAVSGVCLTAVEVAPDCFAADLAAETVARTSFARIALGTEVNLELPMRAGGRMGGHVVQGHVDGVARLLSLEKVEGGEDYWLRCQIPAELAKYVVFKGSIAIEGISLTVARIADTLLTVAIIPHTYEVTNLKSLQPGYEMNLEVDILAKYAEKMLQGEEAPGAVTLEKLLSQGF